MSEGPGLSAKTKESRPGLTCALVAHGLSAQVMLEEMPVAEEPCVGYGSCVIACAYETARLRGAPRVRRGDFGGVFSANPATVGPRRVRNPEHRA